jgi:hypothetical protein
MLRYAPASALLAVLFLVAGCATIGPAAATNPAAMEKAEVSAQYLCDDIPFVQVSSCVREQFNQAYPKWQSDANADLVNIFLAWSGAAAIHVAQGTLSEADAKQKGHMLQARLDQIAYERRINAQINSQLAAQSMLAGLALIAAAQPQPIAAPQVYIAPAQPAPPPVPPPGAYFGGSAPTVTGSPFRSAPPPVTPAPIVCTMMGNAQMATAVCH